MDNPLDQTLSQYFRKSCRTGEIGVEIESEGKFTLHGDSSVWVAKSEDSLRNGGMEFVLRKPISLAALPVAMDDFTRWTAGSTFIHNSRTSVHVHVNLSKATLAQVFSVIMVSWLFENTLVKMQDRDRIGCLFCLRIADAEGTFHSLCRDLQKGKFLSYSVSQTFRYAATNLAALYKFGSMEYRFITGTCDAKEILFWCRTLAHMVKRACLYSPERLVKIFNEEDVTSLLKKFFPRPSRERIKKSFTQKALKADIEENLDLVHLLWRSVKYGTKLQIMTREKVDPPDVENLEDKSEIDNPSYGVSYITDTTLEEI